MTDPDYALCERIKKSLPIYPSIQAREIAASAITAMSDEAYDAEKHYVLAQWFDAAIGTLGKTPS